MPKPREIMRRRRTVKNIEKITSTLKAIATTRFQRATVLAKASEEYATRVRRAARALQRMTDERSFGLTTPRPRARGVFLLVVTSNRGLCGGYNSSVVALAQQRIEELGRQNCPVMLHVAGKKGINQFQHAGHQPAETYIEIADKPTPERLFSLVGKMRGAFERGDVSAVEFVYSRQISAGRFKPAHVTLLPLALSPGPAGAAGAEPEEPVEAFPKAEEFLQQLLPNLLYADVFDGFAQAMVSEHRARMVAMTNATDNAREMDRLLARKYNRARQYQITSELLDILGGVDALSKQAS